MNEQTIVSAFENLVPTIAALAVAALDESEPLAFPEPPPTEDTNAYTGYIAALQGQLAQSYHPLLALSLRDYKAGFPDRAGLPLVEVLEKIIAEPAFKNFSAAGQQKLQHALGELRQF